MPRNLAMGLHDFRWHLASLEADYCQLEAENLGLRSLLVEASLDTEEMPSERVFQHEGLHQMSPVVPINPASGSGIGADAASAAVISYVYPSDDERGTENTKLGRTGSADTIGQKAFGRRTSEVTVISAQSTSSSWTDAGTTSQSGLLSLFWGDRKSGNHRASVCVFPDNEGMKERVRQQVMKKAYNVSEYYKMNGLAQAVAKHWAFESVTLLVIFLNTIWIAVDTDYNHAEVLIDAEMGFQIVESLFCIYLLGELGIRLAAFQRKRDCFGDVWFVTDLVLVLLMVVDTWVMSCIVLISGDSIDTNNWAMLRILRLLRLTRMSRLVRLLRVIPELVVLLKGIRAAARSVFFTLMLLLVLLYVFGIAFAQLLRSTDAGARFFPSVGESMNTLWLYAVLLEEITTLSHVLQKESLFVVLLLDLFILAASFTVMNMLIGVLCEVVSGVASAEREVASISFMKERMELLFYRLGIDTDNNGQISRKEFQGIVENQEATKVISELGVDVVQLVDMADFLFSIDEGGEEKELTFTEFMEVMNHFRGSTGATVADIMQLRKYIRKELSKQGHMRDETLKRTLSSVSTLSRSNSSRTDTGMASPRLSTMSAQGYSSNPRNTESAADGDSGRATLTTIPINLPSASQESSKPFSPANHRPVKSASFGAPTGAWSLPTVQSCKDGAMENLPQMPNSIDESHETLDVE